MNITNKEYKIVITSFYQYIDMKINVSFHEAPLEKTILSLSVHRKYSPFRNIGGTSVQCEKVHP